MTVTFAVDPVEPARDRLPSRPLSGILGEALAIGGDGAVSVVELRGVHPLLAAVHLAFSGHRRLTLSPDALWLTIAQGVAQHVRLNAASLAQELTGCTERRAIAVEWPGRLPEKGGREWAELISRFRQKLAVETRDGFVSTLACDFSTTTDVERVASEIVLMDALAPFFEYRVACICGIPEITLLGTGADYREIARRIDSLEELGLGFWTKSLRPIAEQWIRTAEGHPDVGFWQGIYKPRAAYGEEAITGWIARLFPYVGSEGRFESHNPLLEHSHEVIQALPVPTAGWYSGPSITTDSVPAGPSSVLLLVHDTTSDQPEKRSGLQLEGGLLAVEQTPDGGLVPRAGFVVRRPTASVLTLLEVLHEHPGVSWLARATLKSRPQEDAMLGPVRHESGLEPYPDVNALYHAIEKATLTVGAWTLYLRPATEHIDLDLALSGGAETARVIADVSNGTCLAIGRTSSGPYVDVVDRTREGPIQ